MLHKCTDTIQVAFSSSSIKSMGSATQHMRSGEEGSIPVSRGSLLSLCRIQAAVAYSRTDCWWPALHFLHELKELLNCIFHTNEPEDRCTAEDKTLIGAELIEAKFIDARLTWSYVVIACGFSQCWRDLTKTVASNYHRRWTQRSKISTCTTNGFQWAGYPSTRHSPDLIIARIAKRWFMKL